MSAILEGINIIDRLRQKFGKKISQVNKTTDEREIIANAIVSASSDVYHMLYKKWSDEGSGHPQVNRLSDNDRSTWNDAYRKAVKRGTRQAKFLTKFLINYPVEDEDADDDFKEYILDQFDGDMDAYAYDRIQNACFEGSGVKFCDAEKYIGKWPSFSQIE